MTAEERLDRVERELASTRRYSRWLLAACGLALAGLVTTGATRQADEYLRAREITVVDENGVVRAKINGSGLYQFDEKSNLRAQLHVTLEGSALFLTDESGKGCSAHLAVRKDAPSLTLRDADGKDRAELVANKEGSGLMLRDESGRSRAGLAVNKEGSRLALRDENAGKGSVSLFVAQGGPGHLTLRDTNGTTIANSP